MALVPGASAADANIRCVQTFLEFKGFDPGPLDGASGGRTVKAAATYKAEENLEVPDFSAETAPAWCDMAKSDPMFQRLIGYNYNTTGLWNKGADSERNLDQVLLGDSPGNYVVAERSIKRKGALSFIDLDGGLSAARISVKYEDKGHPEDWGYNNDAGTQQRFELTEERKFSMQPGETYWLRASVFIPAGFDVGLGDQLVLTDLKPMVKGLLLDPVMELKISNNHIQLNHVFGRKQECVIGFNQGGGENTLCDISKEQDYIFPTVALKGTWINFVYRVHWANDDTGTFHLWMNDRLIAGIKGNTLHDAEYITNKFGVYRGYYATQGTPQPEARIYFAGVGRSQTCEGLGLSKCAEFEADVGTFAMPGVIKTNFVELTDMTDYLAAGGKVRKGK